MLNVFHIALSLRGQTWLGFNKWSAIQPTVSHLVGLLPSVFRFGIYPTV